MSHSGETGGLHTPRRGKWSAAAVPHKGWHCVDIEDLGEPAATCDMCESQTIRYVHYMEHPTYNEVLGVGCVCAGHMGGDALGAQAREATMKSRARRRARWLTRRWRRSAQGNDWLRADAYRVTVYAKLGEWRATVAAEDSTLVKHGRRSFATKDAAKLAAFDEITRLLSSHS